MNIGLVSDQINFPGSGVKTEIPSPTIFQVLACMSVCLCPYGYSMLIVEQSIVLVGSELKCVTADGKKKFDWSN